LKIQSIVKFIKKHHQLIKQMICFWGNQFAGLFAPNHVCNPEKWPGWYSVVWRFLTQLKQLNESHPNNFPLKIKSILQVSAIIQITLTDTCKDATNLITIAQQESMETCIYCAMPGQVRDTGPYECIPLCERCGSDYPIFNDNGDVESMEHSNE
jgi:hypothetical protein